MSAATALLLIRVLGSIAGVILVIGGVSVLFARRGPQAAAEEPDRESMRIAMPPAVVDADLRSDYGSNVLAGIACDIDISGATFTALVVLDSSLADHQQTAMRRWAEAEIRGFATSSVADLFRRGWRDDQGAGHWELLSWDGPGWRTSERTYAATAILVGPVERTRGAQIVERLREYEASLEPSQDHDHWVDLKFALCAESRWLANMRAISLVEDLGYPLQRLDVLPV